MTPREIDLILALNRCVFLPGSFAKRFVKALLHRAGFEPNKELTTRQKSYLYQLFHQYRKQIGSIDHNRLCVLCEMQLDETKDRRIGETDEERCIDCERKMT